MLTNVSPRDATPRFDANAKWQPQSAILRAVASSAKALLAKPAPSVTDIGLRVGFSETSSFTADFLRLLTTGV